ncbi:Retrotransposon gag domain [Sesbania bispinosa]|nr:Retrotransposon gag domain [Sesbania bispinosa]
MHHFILFCNLVRFPESEGMELSPNLFGNRRGKGSSSSESDDDEYNLLLDRLSRSGCLIRGKNVYGQNYIQWARSVRTFLQGKGKEDYITENAKEPEKEDPTHQKWKLENSLVMSWLLSSMTHETDNTSAIFEIKSLLHDLRQGDSSVTEYYHSLTRYWQQLDIYEDIDWKCIEDRKQYKTLVEKNRIYQFLLGLNKNLDEVKGRKLGTKPLLSICEAFAEVRKEESRRKIMLGGQINSVNTESSALAARGPQKKNRAHKGDLLVTPWEAEAQGE